MRLLVKDALPGEAAVLRIHYGRHQLAESEREIRRIGVALRAVARRFQFRDQTSDIAPSRFGWPDKPCPAHEELIDDGHPTDLIRDGIHPGFRCEREASTVADRGENDCGDGQ
jgi:hypothetical protein